jgi:asparagine synthase (glutamine-hydrolysing)
MTAVLGIFESKSGALRADEGEKCLHAMQGRGDRRQVVHVERALLGATHFAWELDLAAADRVVRDGDIVVSADATLYYVEDLRRALGENGVVAAGTSPGYLIAGAYRAWGDDCVHHIEGDFAFVLYDQARQRVLCARDFSGRRGLYFANLDGVFVVASAVAGVLAHSGCSNEFNLDFLGAAAAFLFAQETDTPYRAIKMLRAGARVAGELGRPLHDESFWDFPPLNERETGSARDFGDAAEELRVLLADAVQERMAPTGPTALWMSGGHDSPALFGAGQMRLSEANERDRMRLVSMSYPPGDPGREDEFITEIADRWKAPVHWLHIADVPMMDHLTEYAARADVPFVHAFEAFMRALMAGARDVGARVALMGDGGDQLFAVSTVFMLDLFAELRWSELSREWRAFGPQGYRAFFKRVVRPVVRSAARFGRPDTRTLVHQAPPWIRPDFLRAHRLVERELEGELQLRPPGLSRASTETVRSVRYPMQTKVSAAYSTFALESGIEIRVPLLDERIVRFAARRPRSDRASNGEVKRLLRRSMQGLLPESVLAPRKEKTGVLGGYFERSLKSGGGLVAEAFADPILAQIGIVDAHCLQEEWHRFCSEGGQGKGFKLFITLQIELWLRSRLTPVSRSGVAMAPTNGTDP